MERARRERVGKGVRGVVQFRVGITLDFRGDVATSAALSLPPPFCLFLLLPSCLAFCRFYVRGLYPYPSSPDTEKEQQPPGLSARDRSFRAPYLLYIVPTTNTTHSHTHRYIDTLAYECFSRLATRSSHGKTLCTGHYITVNISEVSPPPPESRVTPG